MKNFTMFKKISLSVLFAFLAVLIGFSVAYAYNVDYSGSKYVTCSDASGTYRVTSKFDWDDPNIALKPKQADIGTISRSAGYSYTAYKKCNPSCGSWTTNSVATSYVRFDIFGPVRGDYNYYYKTLDLGGRAYKDHHTIQAICNFYFSPP